MQMIFVSPEEAAIIFGTTAVTIRTWVREGKLKVAPRMGRRHRIYIESIVENSGLSLEQVQGMITSVRAQSGIASQDINKSGATSGVRLVASASSP
jgi:DNA-binding transcriptional MerR regulator